MKLPFECQHTTIMNLRIRAFGPTTKAAARRGTDQEQGSRREGRLQ